MEIKDILVDFKLELLVNTKGRIIAKRTHCSLNFIDIRDLEEKIQIIVKI